MYLSKTMSMVDLLQKRSNRTQNNETFSSLREFLTKIFRLSPMTRYYAKDSNKYQVLCLREAPPHSTSIKPSRLSMNLLRKLTSIKKLLRNSESITMIYKRKIRISSECIIPFPKHFTLNRRNLQKLRERLQLSNSKTK